MNYLDFRDECEESTIPRMGGGASLPLRVVWPEDKDGEPMLHLMTLSPELINTYSNCKIAETHCVSVFIPFKKNSVEHVIDLARRPESARVIAHEIATEIRQECREPLDPPHAITVECDPGRDDEDEFSDEIEPKIGGGPTWLQDVIEAPGKQFLLQLLSSQFNDSWPSHRGMFMGGVVYLFISDHCDVTEERFGQLTIQYT